MPKICFNLLLYGKYANYALINWTNFSVNFMKLFDNIEKIKKFQIFYENYYKWCRNPHVIPISVKSSQHFCKIKSPRFGNTTTHLKISETRVRTLDLTIDSIIYQWCKESPNLKKKKRKKPPLQGCYEFLEIIDLSDISSL